jgi:hypothetical protein
LDGDGVGVGDSLGLLVTETDAVGESDAVGEGLACGVGVGLMAVADVQPASAIAAARMPLSHVWRRVTFE